MVKHELLVPAGDMQCLTQAVANGADAVYIGCKNFGARKFAKNFDNNEIQQAVKICHLYGVKLYVTMNTLVRDEEVPYFLGQVEFLYKSGVDALIMQDFGMICLVREKYPELEIHASTQANTSSRDTAEFYHSIGVKRIVFSREMTLKEIEQIKTPIEKEVFIHGALCISYSGECLMSSMLGSRSGNRGECVGSCRLPYTLERRGRVVQKEKYLLSTKELNTAPRFRDLLDSSITSFKIEGRMKSPEYVGFVTKYYRNVIDNNGAYVLLDEETDKLKTLFTREFTLGHLFETPVDKIMNIETPNHIGLEIGKVIEVNEKKIKIQLDRPLNQQDGIRFLQSGKGFIVNYLYDETDNLIASAPEGTVCFVDNKVELTEYDTVCKTQDYQLITSLKQMPVRKIPITFKVEAKLGKPLDITISDGVNQFRTVGTPVQQAQNAPMDDDRIREQLEKLGDTPFVSTSTLVNCDDNIFIQIKELNDLRRTLTNSLMTKRMEINVNFVAKNEPLQALSIKQQPKVISAYITNLEQQDACRRIALKRIYTSSEALFNQSKIYDDNYFKVPRCKRNTVDNLKNKNLVSDYYDFTIKPGAIGNYPLNVTNIYTMYYLYRYGLETITPSVELSDEDTLKMINLFKQTFQVEPNVEVFAYGRVENMVIKGNILNIEKDDYSYVLIDSKERRFPVFFDGVSTHILNHENKMLTNIEAFKQVASVRLEFYDEKEPDIRKAVKQFENSIIV